MIWVCSDGREIPIEDMDTSHLFNSIRMIWNHAVPEEYRLYPHKRWRISSRLWDQYTVLIRNNR